MAATDYRIPMNLTWGEMVASFDRVFPLASTRRKLLQIFSIILLFEGLSVILLYSKAGLLVGIFSLALGAFLMIMAFPGRGAPASGAAGKPSDSQERREAPAEDTYGIKIVDTVVRRIGGPYVVSVSGFLIIALVLLWNFLYSARPELGDIDTLSLLFGGLLALYPWLVRAIRLETVFALIFLGLVVVLLVVPQAIIALSGDSTSRVGNWYVHYMLAAPFAGILNLIGISASSEGNLVVMEMQDGTIQALGISAYCAGLYSFSIFVSAFVSFVLVFERLPRKLLALVLGLGLAAAYVGNLFRMVVIGVVGYYRGIEALLWAHENAGWMIFLAWSAVFWYLVIRFADKHSARSSRQAPTNAN